jgi:hypothetical protein
MRGRPRVPFLTLRSVWIWDGGKRSGFALLAMAALAAALLWGGRSTPHKEVDVVGVVASEDGGQNAEGLFDSYTFDDGRTYVMQFHGDRDIDGTGVRPNVGDLLIGGSKPSYWLLVATPRDPRSGFPPDCFGLGSQAGHDTATTVELDFGVTLQKAPDFDPTGHGTLGSFGVRGVICLDRQGRVTQINA